MVVSTVKFAVFADASILKLDNLPFDGQWINEEPVYSTADSPQGSDAPFIHLDGAVFDIHLSPRKRPNIGVLRPQRRSGDLGLAPGLTSKCLPSIPTTDSMLEFIQTATDELEAGLPRRARCSPHGSSDQLQLTPCWRLQEEEPVILCCDTTSKVEGLCGEAEIDHAVRSLDYLDMPGAFYDKARCSLTC
jgi:hypothetical protein